MKSANLWKTGSNNSVKHFILIMSILQALTCSMPYTGNMKAKEKSNIGIDFERRFISLIAFGSALMLIYLAIQGPMVQSYIQYKTHPLVINQLIGQDAINLFVMSPILLISSVLLMLKKRLALYLLIMSPLYLMYYALSYMIGWEWMAPTYQGNNYLYFFDFLFVLISAMLILLYALHNFSKRVKSSFSRWSLSIYSVIYSIFLLMFAAMWMQEILEVMETGTSRGYAIAPTAFWLVRSIDLGFCIPLGFVSIYLLWIRPNLSYAVQFLFYGFFMTQILAVLAMAIVMFINHDPTFEWGSTLVFVALAAIVFCGFGYILRNYKQV